MDVIMPQLGETVAEGKVSIWFKQPGDRVEAGENLFEIETDKVTMEVQALASGVLSDVRVKSGETAPVGAVVAVIGEVAISPFSSWGGVRGGATASRAANGSAPFKLAPFAETDTPTGKFGKAEGPLGIKITPLARRLIAQNGVDIAGLEQAAKTRGAWRIGRAEVEAALCQDQAPGFPAPSPSPQGGGGQAAPGRTVAFNAVRRATGRRLQQSWQTVPHVFQAVEVDFSVVDRVRAAGKDAFKARHGASLTYLPFIARALVIAIADFPNVNARLEGEGLTAAAEIHLGIAVDLAHNGLVVPVIRNADELTVAGLAKAIARQVEKGRAGRLAPDDLAGGTCTISNNGAFGTLFTAPIVNPPQVAILSIDAVRKRPVVVESEAGDSIAIRPVGVVGQSFDHRAFDGAYSAAFLARLKAVLETRDWAGELT